MKAKNIDSSGNNTDFFQKSSSAFKSGSFSKDDNNYIFCVKI